MRRPHRTVLALAAGAAMVAGCGSSAELPQITYYADGRTVVGGPVVYCQLDFRSCASPGDVTELAVPPGLPLQISLPNEIGEAPWRLITVSLDAAGVQQATDEYFRPGERLAVTVGLDGTSLLQGVEIQLPSGAEDEEGNPVARAAWSLQNTYLPDA